MKKRLLALFLVLALLLSACACATKPAQAPTPAEATNPETTETPTTATGPVVTDTPVAETAFPSVDRAGNPMTLTEAPKRIISMAPAYTQVIGDLGCLELLVGVDSQTGLIVSGVDASLPQFDMMAPDIEALAALEPDLMLVSGLSSVEGEDPFAQLRELGVCIAAIPTSESLAGAQEDVQFIADCLGRSAEGKALVDQMQADMDAIAAIGATITEKKSVLFEISALPYIYSFGNGVYLDEMLTLIGATNAMGAETSWIAVTEEAAIAANPDVILTNVNYLDDPVGEILARAGWESVAAVANKAVYAVDNNLTSLPNHHLAEAMREMALAIYPDVYAGLK